MSLSNICIILLMFDPNFNIEIQEWVWTTKIDTATLPFLKFDMRHGALVTRQEGVNQ